MLKWIKTRWLLMSMLVGVAAIMSVAGCSHLEQKERELVFRIEPGTARWYNGLPGGVQEFNLPSPRADSTEYVHAWWWPAGGRDAPAVLYLHGSRWNLTGQLFRIEQLREMGFSVLAIDYRGFGQSRGDLPSERTVYEDARVAWQRLVELQPEPARRFIYGHSLGGAVAVDLAHGLAATEADAEPAVAAGLIVESTFTTLGDIAQVVTNTRLPVRWLLSQKFDSVDKIAAVRLPVLLVHGTADRYVPARFSEKLFERAVAPKKLLLIEGGTHNNSMRTGKDDYRRALNELFGIKARGNGA